MNISKICCFIILSFSLKIGYAQNTFEGKIKFMYYHRDTTKNIYIVKNNNIRLDQYSKKNDGTIEGSFLFHLDIGEIKILSHRRKLWNTHKSTLPPTTKGEYKVTKTNNVKKILGAECTEYIVENKEEDTEVSYWITNKGNYDFFIPLLKLWNRKDKQSVYFSKINNLSKGSMPFLSIEKQKSSGRILSKLEVIKISNEKISDNTFIIPKDYKKFEE